MAHLTSVPFKNNTAQFEYPQRHPLSPPETTADSPATAMATPPAVPSLLASRNVLDHEELSARLSESPSSRFRKFSTLSYHAPSLRETRERAPQIRPSKPLVIVIPPPAILHEHGQLGHTLSQGPSHRLSQGILMPLLPTMYGQLTAIAREFNFPSTSGLCIYYHFSENGFISTPRVSDESWSSIWSHVFEDRSAVSPPRPPIGGKIEFDIDTRQARWYATWLGSSRLERPMSVSPSVAHDHARIESKTTLQEDTMNDVMETPFRPKSRHIPRKLSLVDRFESMSARSTAAPGSGSVIPSPPAASVAQQHLSPIPQVDEPLTAKMDLEKKVTSWRSSASLRPSTLALKGQTSLEPANMPNSMSLDDASPPSGEDEMDLADYDWSVSSRGPPDYDENESLSSVSRIPSIHLAHRAQGSVCLTPSVCTSFGPFDYDIYSPVSSIQRLPTPDIAHRMLDDAPPTPSTATSWGAPLSYPPSPVSERSLFSLDVAHRAVFSRPVTPETATSWGAPSWPASPVESERPRSIHLDGRAEFSRPLTPVDIDRSASMPWSHVFPHNHSHEDPMDLTHAAPWPLVWPYHHQPHTEVATSAQDIAEPLVQTDRDISVHSDDEDGVPSTSASHLGLVWPYHHVQLVLDQPEVSRNIESLQPPVSTNEEAGVVDVESPAYPPLQVVWPYTAQSTDATADVETIEASALVESAPQSVAPQVVTTLEEDTSTRTSPQLVWPYDASSAASVGQPLPEEPESTTSVLVTVIDPFEEDTLLSQAAPWKLVWPYNEHAVSRSDVDIPSEMPSEPTSDVEETPEEVAGVPAAPWHHVWPYNHPYSDVTESLSVDLHQQLGYPYLSIYSTIYPNFDLYPAIPAELSPPLSAPVILRLSLPYPTNLLAIYPPVVQSSPKPYPEHLNEIYLPLVGPTFLQASRPYPLNLYELYPSLDPYRSCTKPYPTNLEEIYSDISVHSRDIHAPPPSRLGTSRPYPANLYEIYPSLGMYPGSSRPYPTNLDEIYLTIPGYEGAIQSHHDCTPKSYPVTDIYPPVAGLYHGSLKPYPSNLAEIYDQVASIREIPPSSLALAPISVRLPATYPSFDLYPPVYPFVTPYPACSTVEPSVAWSTVCPVTEIYPSVRGPAPPSPISVRLDAGYPILDLYPAMYPHFSIYPSVCASEPNHPVALSVRTRHTYPVFDLYPAVYPTLEIYPPVASVAIKSLSIPPITIDYPHFDLYPAVVSPIPLDSRILSHSPLVASLTLPTVYPYFNLYPPLYPTFHIYPPAALMSLSVQEERSSPGAFSGYPFFNLYSPIYPYVEVYPVRYECTLQSLGPSESHFFEAQTVLRPPSVVVQPPTPTPTRPATFKRSPPPVPPRPMPSRVPLPKRRANKLTHSELHAMVIMETSFETRSSFDDDDDDDDNIPFELPRRAPPIPSPSPRRSLRRVSISQVPLPRISIPNLERAVPFAQSIDSPPRKQVVVPAASAPLRRSVSAVSKPSQRFDQKMLNRRSIGLPSSPRALKQLAANSESPTSSPVRVPPQRRDSLVLQRVRAYNAKDAGEPLLSMDTISEFPLPPPSRIPGPR